MLSFYPPILCLMKNWCSSELSRFKGNNYQSSDLCFSSPANKHPVPWGTLGKWYSFKWVKFHSMSTPLPPPSTSSPPSTSFPLRGFISQKCEHIFLFWRGQKNAETIKNMKSPSSQNIRHHKTTQSYDWIYQNWQVKVDCLLSVDWAILHGPAPPLSCFHRAPKPAAWDV